MTFEEAIARQKNRLSYLEQKLIERTNEAKPTFWIEQDIESARMAISALTFAWEMEIYEQQKQE